MADLPTGGELGTRVSGGLSNGRGAQGGGRRESASQERLREAQDGAAGPKPCEGRRRAQPRTGEAPGDRGACGGPGGQMCAKVEGGGKAGKGSLRRPRRRRSPVGVTGRQVGGAVTSGRGRAGEGGTPIRQPCRLTPAGPSCATSRPTPRPQQGSLPAAAAVPLTVSPPRPSSLLRRRGSGAAIFRTASTTAPLSGEGARARRRRDPARPTPRPAPPDRLRTAALCAPAPCPLMLA